MPPPRSAQLLGYFGLIPFIALGLAAVAGPELHRSAAAEGLLIYGVSILSFMGGCRWGFAAAGLGSGPAFTPLAVSVLPALLAWVTLWGTPLIGERPASALLLVGFAALYVSDLAATRAGGAPTWWPALRGPLTLGASGSLAAFATMGS